MLADWPGLALPLTLLATLLLLVCGSALWSRRRRASPRRPEVMPTEERPPGRLDHVRFSVYHPRQIEPGRWYSLFAAAYLDLGLDDSGRDPERADPAEAWRDSLKHRLGIAAAGYREESAGASAPVPREARLSFRLDIPGIEVNPDEYAFLWVEDIHRAEFRLRASDALDGSIARGRMSVYFGPLILAQLAFAIRVDSAAQVESPAEGPGQSAEVSARPYRKIFASYAHRDEKIVRFIEAAAKAFGDDYLRDVYSLRSGEHWDQALLRLIEQADVFQLFWSSNALRSEFVRREWEHALSLGRAADHFIRPVYWEDPLPESTDGSLPPEALRSLHFHKLAADVLSQVVAPGDRREGPPKENGPTPADARDDTIALDPPRPERNDPGGIRLVELLTVVSVVGVLIALLLPAVQSAREAARRMQCVSNLKQLGLAMSNYHDTHNALPPGRIWAPRPGRPAGDFPTIFAGAQNTPWFVQLLPYIEERASFNAFNFELGSEGLATPNPADIAAGLLANSTVTNRRIASLQCPSDQVRTLQFPPVIAGGRLSGPVISKGNYAANWGNTNWGAGRAGHAGLIPLYLRAPFGHDAGLTFGDIVDGTSQTVFLAEVLQGATNDPRGATWSILPGGAIFMTRFTPNGTRDFYASIQDLSGGDNMPGPPGVLCRDEPGLGLPCRSIGSDNDSFAGARSRHPGRVNVAFGDGSVRAVRDGIEPTTWIGLGAIAGGERVFGEEF